MFGKIKGTIDKSVATITVKSGEFVEISKIKTRIQNDEKEIAKLEATLGKAYYHQWIAGVKDEAVLNDIAGEIKAFYDDIDAGNKEIEELQESNNKILNTEEKVECPNCHAENRVGVTFCVACGSRLVDEDMIVCQCGNKVKKTAKFCAACGKPVEIPVAPAVAEAVVEVPASEEPAVEEPVVEEAKDVIICSNCGKELPLTAKFCNGCGQKIE